MPNLTTNYSLNMPLVNNPTDMDLWGGYLNTSMDTIDGLLFSALTWTISAKTASFVVAVTAGNTFFLCDCTAALVAATLPSAATVGAGFTLAFKKTDASAYTLVVTPAGAETVDGAVSYIITVQNEVVEIISDGTNWVTLVKTANQLPVGSVYINRLVATNPATLLGYGTWTALGQGRFLAGVGTGTDGNSDTLAVTVGATGGEYNHTLLTTEMPSHTHDANKLQNDAGLSGTKGNWYFGNFGSGSTTAVNGTLAAGGGLKHNNTPPYIGVYMWYRSA